MKREKRRVLDVINQNLVGARVYPCVVNKRESLLSNKKEEGIQKKNFNTLRPSVTRELSHGLKLMVVSLQRMHTRFLVTRLWISMGRISCRCIYLTNILARIRRCCFSSYRYPMLKIWMIPDLVNAKNKDEPWSSKIYFIKSLSKLKKHRKYWHVVYSKGFCFILLSLRSTIFD